MPSFTVVMWYRDYYIVILISTTIANVK